MKLTQQQKDTLIDMADWLTLKAPENWDGFDDQQIAWFINNANLIRTLATENNITA